jgi:hypothetical protein
MNVRKGAVRLWIVLSVLFVIAIAVISYSDIHTEFRNAYSGDSVLGQRSLARGCLVSVALIFLLMKAPTSANSPSVGKQI